MRNEDPCIRVRDRVLTRNRLSEFYQHVLILVCLRSLHKGVDKLIPIWKMYGVYMFYLHALCLKAINETEFGRRPEAGSSKSTH